MNHTNASEIFDWTQQFFESGGSGPYQYHDPGAKCSDHVDGNLNHAVEIAGNTISLPHIGVYTITYNCRDLSGNSATEQSRIVQVVDSNDCANTNGGNPKILVEPKKIAYEAGFIYADYGVSAYDPKLSESIASENIVAYENVVNTYKIFSGHSYTNCMQIQQRCTQVCQELGAQKCPGNESYRLCNPGKYKVSANDAEDLICFRRFNTDDFTTYQNKITTCNTGYDDVQTEIQAAYDSGNTTSDYFVLAHIYQRTDFCKKQNESLGGFNPAVPTKSQFNARVDPTDGTDELSFTITYGVQDRDANPQCEQTTRVVTVEDTMPPVIHLKWTAGANHGAEPLDLRNTPERLGKSIIDNRHLPATQPNDVRGQYRVFDNSAEVLLPGSGSHLIDTSTDGTAKDKVHSYESVEMAEVGRNVNGWIVAGFGFAVTGLAFLTSSSKKTTQIEV